MREVQARGFPPGRAEHRAPTPQEFEGRVLGWAHAWVVVFPAVVSSATARARTSQTGTTSLRVASFTRTAPRVTWTRTTGSPRTSTVTWLSWTTHLAAGGLRRLGEATSFLRCRLSRVRTTLSQEQRRGIRPVTFDAEGCMVLAHLSLLSLTPNLFLIKLRCAHA